MQFCKGYNIHFLVEAQVIPIFTHNYVNQLDKKNRNAQLQTKNVVEMHWIQLAQKVGLIAGLLY